MLSECLALNLTLVPEEAKTVRCRRGTLQSNAAQVCLSRREFPEARRLAKAAMEDDPENTKSLFRLARAEIELREWSSAAKIVDEAIIKSRTKKKSEEADANVLELWKLAEEVSKALPDWKWSSSKPQAKSTEDFEKRLIGFWKYSGGQYQIKVEPWGALIFTEEKCKIDLMRKSKLTWRGEWEEVPGMAIVLTYEPGCDIVVTQFIPPEEGLSEEQQWKGETRFTASRAAVAPEPPPETWDDLKDKLPDEPVPFFATAAAAAASPVLMPQAEDTPAAPSVLDDARILWLSGHADFCGCYELLPENTQNDRPVYQRSPGGDLFLWYRGGNWGATKTIHASALAAPFLARCGDPSGISRHPLDIRRPRWHVRRGRNQEDLDPSVSLSASDPSSAADAGYPEPSSASAEPKAAGASAAQAKTSPAVARASSQWPSWVGDVSVEQSGDEVKVAVVVREGLDVLKSLSLDVGGEVLKVSLPSEGTLSVALGAQVDTDTLPVARLSEKKRMLTVRLAIRSRFAGLRRPGF